MIISVLNSSHNKRESGTFHQIVENGFGPKRYLFVHFIYPAVVVINNIEYKTDRSACIIYTPGQRQEYKSYNGVFKNDFLVFEADDPHFAARYGLPENEIFYISNGDEVTLILEKITYRLANKMVDFSLQLQERTIKLFETLSKSCISNKPNKKRMFEIRQRFIALRDEINKDPKDWSIEKMAKRVWFTRSRFTVLYKDFFEISPNADLTNIRIEYAKNLLKTTDMSIVNVSDMCGYSSADHFIRIFNKKVKYTPLQYRKKMLSYNENP